MEEAEIEGRIYNKRNEKKRKDWGGPTTPSTDWGGPTTISMDWGGRTIPSRRELVGIPRGWSVSLVVE